MFSFQRVDGKQHAKVLEWLRKPHVKAYFHGEGLQNTLRDLDAQVTDDTAEWEHWVASRDGVDFGYLITSDVQGSEEFFNKHMQDGESAITLDILIGEESMLGRGLAVPMIHAFLREKKAEKVFIDPACQNERAIHVYKKAGFKIVEEFIARWDPVPHYLMMLDVKAYTNRLLIRELTEGDVDALMEIWGDPAVMEFSLKGAMNREEVRAFLQERVLDHYKEHGVGLWALCFDGKVIGVAGLMRQEVEGHRFFELGYRLKKDSWGRGFATEACTAIRDYALDVLGLDSVISIIAEKNIKSVAVAKRLGMHAYKTVSFHGFEVTLYKVE